jgi:hypothetical protein
MFVFCIALFAPPPANRAAHQRLVAHAEEVAFNDPPAGAAEQLILNQHLQRLITFTRLSSFQRFMQQVRGAGGVGTHRECSQPSN